jgi:hypothetical protein
MRTLVVIRAAAAGVGAVQLAFCRILQRDQAGRSQFDRYGLLSSALHRTYCFQSPTHS